MIHVIRSLKYLSAFLPAFFSFAFNLIVARNSDVFEYSNYILIISWATFLGTISAWSFVDMSISRKLGNSVPSDNLFLSLVSSLFICAIFFVIGKNVFISDNFLAKNTLLITCFAITFSWTRIFGLYLANTQQNAELFRARVLRSISLFFFGCSLIYFDVGGYSLAIIFQIIAFCVGLLHINKFFSLFAWRSSFSTLSMERIKSSSLRTLSLGVDMLHIPLSLLAVNKVIASNLGEEHTEAYILGLGLPAITIIVQVLNEFFRGQVAFMLDWLQCIPRLRTFSVVFLIGSVLLCISYTLYLPQSFYFVFGFFIIGKLLSSFTGLLVYKMDYERFDLAVNVLITCVIGLGFLSDYSGSWGLVNFIIAAVATKYFVILAVVLAKIKEV